ncbi:hypothetical protein OPT61_g8409 [Boeremia exigua]|uniref:Uncharacterized protein n=1 Tax=Boeremia exigua TaxID=749465 RepID=A0ACC2HZ74_9PLEO|nr:hypothetical protein OPT61_g8409 [Boeremia exigua]
MLYRFCFLVTMPIPVLPGALAVAYRVICICSVRALARGNAIDYAFKMVLIYVGAKYKTLASALAFFEDASVVEAERKAREAEEGEEEVEESTKAAEAQYHAAPVADKVITTVLWDLTGEAALRSRSGRAARGGGVGGDAGAGETAAADPLDAPLADEGMSDLSDLP